MKLLEKTNSHAPSTRRAREKFPPRTAWRAQKSATAKKSREKSTAFFTGKPYIESLGSYSFLFRNYNPALCRWTTPDPSGFPDGANPNIYVNNGATSSFDYEGLYALALKFDNPDQWSKNFSNTPVNDVTLELILGVTFGNPVRRNDQIIGFESLRPTGTATFTKTNMFSVSIASIPLDQALTLNLGVTDDGKITTSQGGGLAATFTGKIALGLKLSYNLSADSKSIKIQLTGSGAVSSTSLTGVGITAGNTGAGANVAFTSNPPNSFSGSTGEMEIIVVE